MHPGYPRLADVPQIPTDQRTKQQWDAARAELMQVNAQLDRLAAAKRAQSAAYDGDE